QATGEELQRVNTCPPDRSCGAFSADGKLLALPCDHGTICLYDAATGSELQRMKKPFQGTVASLALSLDGKLLASKPDFDATVTLWDADTGKEVRELKPPEHEFAGFGSGLIPPSHGLAFSPDGRMLAAASEHGVLRLWQVSTGKLLRRGEVELGH